MKILFVNNVCSILGGTLNCTLSMVQAFPDAECTVYGFGHRFGPQEYEAFPPNVKLVSGSNLGEFVRGHKFDVVVYQNTSVENMPHVFLNNPITVYYQHNNHRSAKQAREKCDLVFCVSKYLADQVGLNESHVLYQPVTIPQAIEDEDYDEWASSCDVVVGRICTPTPAKWDTDDLIPLYEELGKRLGEHRVGFHFIGATDSFKKKFGGVSHWKFDEPSFKARGYFHEWNYLLYKSSLPETYGRTVKEAQRCGCIPIVSNLGGFREQIDNGKDGYLCDTSEDFVNSLFLDIEEERAYLKVEESVSTFRKEFLRRLNAYINEGHE